MPKRQATPPPGDDEPKYLTICYPYPPHANMELPGDRLALARWLVCCMKTSNDLYAIFHKPSAPNMIIIEVRRDHPAFRRLLGAHKWSEFVKSPGEHKDKVTRIYFSTFSSGRAVEKAGWKRIFVSDDWFQGFSPNNRYIAYPYPISRYCDLPSENQTGLTLCRPIPLEPFYMRAPSPPPPVPVGSAGWVAHKETADGSMKSCEVASEAAYAQAHIPFVPPRASLCPELKMPAPPLHTSVVSNPKISTNISSSSVHGNRDSPRYPSSSSVSNHCNSSNHGNSGGAFAGDHGRPGNADKSEGYNHVARGYFNAPKMTDEFGSLSLHPRTNEDGTPVCPSHGVVCRKGICRDYSNLLKKKEKEQQQASSNKDRSIRGHPRGWTSKNGFPTTPRGRGRGHSRARGFSSTRGRRSPRGRGSPSGPASASDSRA